MKNLVSIVFLILVIIALIVFGPLAIIWALNTLFPVLAISYGFWQWLAVVVLNLTWFSATKVKQ